MNTSKIRSPFPWFGGKGNPRIKSALLAALPPHSGYVEPFGGGARLAGACRRALSDPALLMTF